MKYCVWIALLVFTYHTGFTQADTVSAASVVVHKDARIGLLVKKQSSINAATKKSSGYSTKGYRLLVMNTTNRDEVITAKSKIYSRFPELKAYLIYQSPFFRLKAGNFKTREEAVRYQQQMQTMFPKGVFIVNDTIEVKPEKSSNSSSSQSETNKKKK